MRNLITVLAVVFGVGGLAAGAALADHTYGDWQTVPQHMVGDTCDAIDNGSATFVLGEHAMYVDKNGTRYVITMPGRICSS